MPRQASKTDIGWGHQIRSYVLQPYQLVKDLRTGVELDEPAGRARRRLDRFMEAALRINGGRPDEVARPSRQSRRQLPCHRGQGSSCTSTESNFILLSPAQPFVVREEAAQSC